MGFLELRRQCARSGGEKGLRGSGAGTLGVPLGGTRRVGGLLGFAGGWKKARATGRQMLLWLKARTLWSGSLMFVSLLVPLLV